MPWNRDARDGRDSQCASRNATVFHSPTGPPRVAGSLVEGAQSLGGHSAEIESRRKVGPRLRLGIKSTSRFNAHAAAISWRLYMRTAIISDNSVLLWLRRRIAVRMTDDSKSVANNARNPSDSVLIAYGGKSVELRIMEDAISTYRDSFPERKKILEEEKRKLVKNEIN